MIRETRYSEILKQDIHIDHKTKTVLTEDGVLYSMYEMKLLNNKSNEMKRTCHKIKKIFKGMMVNEYK